MEAVERRDGGQTQQQAEEGAVPKDEGVAKKGPEKVIRLVSQLHEKHKMTAEVPFNPLGRPTRFLLMFVRGSGSTWVQALLNQQPHFFCGPETALTPEFFEVPSSSPSPSSGYEPSPSSSDSTSTTSASTTKRTLTVPANAFFGFKNKMDHLPEWAQQRILRREPPEVTFIFMRRRDVVRHAIGLCRKNQLAPRQGFWATHKAGKGNAWSEKDVVGAGPIDVEEFKKELGFVREEEAELAAFEAALTAAGIPSLAVWYEDFLEDHVAQLRRVYRWIVGSEEGFVVPSNDLEGAVPVKNTPLDLASVVTNLDDLRTWVAANTNFTWYD